MGRPWDERWVIGEKVGTGGQGITCHATWRDDNSVHGVLKYLKNNKSAPARARMLREVAALQSLAITGGNFPRVLDHNTAQFEDLNVELFVVMSFIPGKTLKEFVESNGPLTIDRSVHFALGLCKTIRIAHGINVLHRDLKPDNIIVRDPEASDLVIVDYGLSFNSGDEAVTEAGETFRNKFLDLPETNTQGGDRRDPRSDLTAVCAILYYCTTSGIPGQLLDGNHAAPHKRSGFTIADSQKDDKRVQLVDDFLTRGFSVMLDNRFQSVDQMETELSGLLIPIETDMSDPTQLARTISRRLAVGHRKTQLASFVPFAQAVFKKLTEEMKKYQQLGEFSHSMRSIQSSQGIKLPQGLDLVMNEQYLMSLKPKHHTSNREMLLAVCSREGKCVLAGFVKNVEGDARPRAGFGGPKVSWETPVEVAWFEGNPEPVFPVISMYIRKWLTDSLTEIGEEMLKPT